jgi:nitrogen regulatory protein PII-like uncharacterized protein
MSKKIKAKVNPLLLEKTTVRDTVTGTVFNHNDWVEIDEVVWERLAEATYKQGRTKIAVLISDTDEDELDDFSAEEDNESVEEVVEDFFIAEEE